MGVSEGVKKISLKKFFDYKSNTGSIFLVTFFVLVSFVQY
jgi:hypothetical protein